METDIARQDLDDRRDRIIGHLERAAIDIGNELLEAKAAHPGEFQRWVIRELPITPEKASQLMAIARGLKELPPEVRELLPRAFTVLLPISKMDDDVIEMAVTEGVFHPKVTRREVEEFQADKARGLLGVDKAAKPKRQPWKPGPKPGFNPNTTGLTTDIVARELIRRSRLDLTQATEALLRKWLDPEGDHHG